MSDEKTTSSDNKVHARGVLAFLGRGPDGWRKSAVPHGFGRLEILLIVVEVCFALNGVFFMGMLPSKRILMLVALSLIAPIVLWFFIRRGMRTGREDCLSRRVFPVVLAVCAMLFCVLFAPLASPDEDYHYAKSYVYANHLMPFAFGSDDIREEDYAFIHDSDVCSEYMKPDVFDKLQQKFSLFASHDGTRKMQVSDDSPYVERRLLQPLDVGADPPQLKLPSALGINLGRLLNLSGLATFYLGRIFNALFGVLLIAIAVRLTPVGKNIMMAASLMPAALNLIGSYSYDVGIIGLSFLCVAILLRMILGTGRLEAWEMPVLLGLGVLLAPCKIVYYCLLFLVLLVPGSRFATRRSMMMWKAAVLVVPLLSIVLLRLPALALITTSSAENGMAQATRGQESGELYTLTYALQHPFATVLIILRTLREQTWTYAMQFAGKTLGYFQRELAITDGQVMMLLLLMFASGMRAEDDAHVLSRRQRIVCLVVAGVVTGCIFMSMLTGWTFVSDPVIAGVQGRYLIPIIVCILLGLRGRTIEIHARLAPAIMLALGSFAWLLAAQTVFNVMCGLGA